MIEMGFTKSGRHWKHPNCLHLFVEFCSPPVSIGDDFHITTMEIKKNGTSIFILSPTDCVKDRMAGYIHWDAKECLDQAVLVLGNNKNIDFKELKRWYKSEHKKGEKYYDELVKKFNAKLQHVARRLRRGARGLTETRSLRQFNFCQGVRSLAS